MLAIYRRRPQRRASSVRAKNKDFSLAAAGTSRQGRRHSKNEDAFAVDQEHRIVVIADGMGATRGARFCSWYAVDHLLAELRDIPVDEHLDKQVVIAAIQNAFLSVNRQIVALGNHNPHLFGMGTTAVVGMVRNDLLYIASLGDSRAYLLRGGCLWQYTVDHTMAQALVASGVISMSAARRHHWRHQLWKHLGRADLAQGPDVSVIRLEAGDRALFVTDGVTKVFDRHALAELAAITDTPAQIARAITTAAAAAGSTDDITCIAMHFAQQQPA